jgi:hypothetical protein
VVTASSLFSAADYAALAAIVFRPDYPGNATARGVVEAPAGDPAARDTGKKYAHVALKYLRQMAISTRDGWADRNILDEYLMQAHQRATEVAYELNVPSKFMPSFEHGALRVLEYPPGAGSAPHTDVGLLTLNLYRDQPDKLRTYDPERSAWVASDSIPEYHLGRLAREIGIGAAMPHDVIGSVTEQHSIVYFAVPNHDAMLPSGQRLGNWLDRAMAKMRYDR